MRLNSCCRWNRKRCIDILIVISSSDIYLCFIFLLSLQVIISFQSFKITFFSTNQVLFHLRTKITLAAFCLVLKQVEKGLRWLSIHLNDDSRKSSHITVTTKLLQQRSAERFAVKSSQASLKQEISSSAIIFSKQIHAYDRTELQSGEIFVEKS